MPSVRRELYDILKFIKNLRFSNFRNQKEKPKIEIFQNSLADGHFSEYREYKEYKEKFTYN